jgi:Tfp pilus assembly protein PilX
MPRGSKGIALILVISAILIMIILAETGIKFTLSNTSLSLHSLDSTRAFYFAEAGIQRAMYKIKNVVPPTSESWTTFVAGQTINITISASNPYDVISICGLRTANKRIEAKINKDPTTVQLLEWRQIN